MFRCLNVTDFYCTWVFIERITWAGYVTSQSFIFYWSMFLQLLRISSDESIYWALNQLLSTTVSSFMRDFQFR